MRRIGIIIFILIASRAYSQNINLPKNVDSVNISVVEYDTIVLPPDTVFLPPDTINKIKVVHKLNHPANYTGSEEKMAIEAFVSLFNMQGKSSPTTDFNASWSYNTGLNLYWKRKYLTFKTGLNLLVLNENKTLHEIKDSTFGSDLLHASYTAEFHNRAYFLSVPLEIGYCINWRMMSLNIFGGPGINYLFAPQIYTLNTTTDKIDKRSFSGTEKLYPSFSVSADLGYNLPLNWKITTGILFKKCLSEKNDLPEKFFNGYIALNLGIRKKF